MSYYYARSPHDVQQENGKRWTFDTIKEKYETTKPINSKKRTNKNVRPLSERRRHWERVGKVSDTEYYISCQGWRDDYYNCTSKAVTFKRDDVAEYVTIHTPRTTWHSSNKDALDNSAMSSSSVFNFYRYNLPVSLSMGNFQHNKYIIHQVDNGWKYYTIELGDVTFMRLNGATEWTPLVVHREFKHTLDRTRTKELREMVKPFMDYFMTIKDIIANDLKWYYGSTLAFEPQPTAEQLFTVKDGEIPERWMTMVERCLSRVTNSWIHGKDINNPAWLRDAVQRMVIHNLYELDKPCKAEEVELGTITNDRYKRWYR